MAEEAAHAGHGEDHGRERLGRDEELGRGGDYVGGAAEAGDDARGVAEHQRRDCRGRREGGGEGLAEGSVHHLCEPDGRDVPRGDGCVSDEAKVIGQGMLDSARYRTFIAWETKSSVEDVHAQVLGGHTEATMVPVVSTAHVGGVPLTSLLSKKIEGVVERAKRGGAEIVELLKTGSAYYAPAAATVEMVEAVLLDKKRILPCATLASGQFGINGAFVGLPVKVGARGIESVYEPPLWDSEIDAIRTAAESTRELVGLIEKPKAGGKKK